MGEGGSYLWAPGLPNELFDDKSACVPLGDYVVDI